MFIRIRSGNFGTTHSAKVEHKLALNDSAGFYNMQDFIKGIEKIIDSNKNTRITLYTSSVV